MRERRGEERGVERKEKPELKTEDKKVSGKGWERRVNA